MKVPSPAVPSKTRRFLRMTPSSPGSSSRFRDGDREALVEVAGPGDVGFEEDFLAEQFEAEAGGFAVGRFDVVDGGRRDRERDADDGVGRGDGGGTDPSPDRVARAGGGFEGGEVAARGRSRVDAEADRQVDANVLQFPDRFFEGPRFAVFDDELREADGRMAGCLFEELGGGVDAAGRSVDGAGSRLPAGVDGRVLRIAGGDDAAGVGSGERGHRPQGEQAQHQPSHGSDPSRSLHPSPLHPNPPPSIHSRGRPYPILMT